MELSLPLIFKTAASLAGVLVAIGMFSELSWSVKLKVAATLLAGAILIGFLAPLRKPAELVGAVSLPALGGKIILVGLAVLAGFIGYFISRPYGREIGVLAVPFGLSLWAVRYGNMAELMRLNPTLAQRQGLFAALKWEPIFWLFIVAAGFAGMFIGQKILPKSAPNKSQMKTPLTSKNIYLNAIITVILSIFIAQFCIGVLAQGVRIGSIVGQPAVGQIVFAVLVSFGIIGFLFKKFLDTSYIWPTIASALVTGFIIITKVKQDTLQHLIEHYPPVFFSNAVISILPVQMVAFGTLGSIAGYWLAVHISNQKSPDAT